MTLTGGLWFWVWAGIGFGIGWIFGKFLGAMLMFVVTRLLEWMTKRLHSLNVWAERVVKKK